MFFIFLIASIGIFYLFYRYRAVSNKALFFRSPLFVAFSGSAGILLTAIAITNFLAPEKKIRNYLIAADSLTSRERDTSAIHLLQQSPAYHYELLQKLNTYDKYLPVKGSLTRQYETFANGKNGSTRDMGLFGLGVLATLNDSYDEALRLLNGIGNASYPFVHFLKGDIYIEMGKPAEARKEFETELLIAGGNFPESYVKLIDLYQEAEDFASLRQLLEYEPAEDLFPENLARKTLLQSGDAGAYLLWLGRSVNNQVNILGLIAALAISLVWLIYLIHLDFFRNNRITGLLVMFVSGFLSVFLVISFNDLFDLYSSWSRDGGAVNDFFYCMFMIALPEELTKIFPLVALLIFVRRLSEPLDYILYASAGALGFAFIENLLYFQDVTDDGIIHGRAYLSAIGHMVDSSIVAYGFVLLNFRRGKRPAWLILLLSLSAGVISHGMYDFLLFQGYVYLFFLFFIFVIQIWIIIINNCLNNSTAFSYRLATRPDAYRIFISLAMTSIFALEYVIIGFSTDTERANGQLLANSSSAIFLIVFFSSNLSSFDLIRGYWRDVYFKSREKRGYGSRSRRSLLVSWYFVNAIRAHNYVGAPIHLKADLYNRDLDFFQPLPGRIIDRITLAGNNEADPQWFLVKLFEDIPFHLETNCNQRFVLVKLRYPEDSLFYEDEVQVLLKAIPIGTAITSYMEKSALPFLGFAYLTHQQREAVLHVSKTSIAG